MSNAYKISKEELFFLKKALLFCLVLIGLSLVLFDTILKDYYLKIYPLQFAVVSLVTVISHLKLMNSFQLNTRRFNTTFLSVMSIKLFLYLVFILICLLIDRTSAFNFVITFLLLYLGFTIFEVIEISNFLKKNPKSSN
jgi:L-asparagine transporter-like permease